MMTRLPTLTARKILKALDQAGFEVERQTGSHIILRNPLSSRTTCVPLHGKDVKRSLMKEILRQAGLSEEEFQELL
jgi:predicted RNA binding protein YcfA (HicA-like mRNA interferase family)